jgi:hypothetical protein
MPASTSGEDRAIAHKLMPFFVARFIANGNVYDQDRRTTFTDEDKAALKAQHKLETEQCTCFARNAYARHQSEDSFRKYINVPKTGNSVSSIVQYSCCLFSVTERRPNACWQHVAVFIKTWLFNASNFT